MIYIGIDCSKATFDVAIPKMKGYQASKLGNVEEGFRKLLELLPADCQCVMEASGPYFCRLATFLCQHQVAVSVVNPLVVKRFAQMRLVRMKTDKADAMIIAQYAEKENPPLWKPSPDYTWQIGQEMTLAEQLIKQKTALLNQQQAFEQLPYQSCSAFDSLQKVLTLLEEQIDALEKSIYEKVKQHDEKLFSNLQSVPGIGPKTAAVLITITKSFLNFTNYRQLISYLGLAPRICQSGTSIKGKGNICKMGTGRIRALLFMCGIQAKKCNPACKALFERLLSKSKPYKVAIMAVANKLLKQAFAIAKSGSPFQATFVKVNLTV
jgi:transposase